MRFYRVLLDSCNKVRILQKSEIMSDRLESPFVLQLSLHLLKRNYLRWRAGSHRKHLTQQSGATDDAERQHVPANGWLDDGIAQICTPALWIPRILNGPRIRSE